MSDSHTGHRQVRLVPLQQASSTDIDRLARLANKCHHDDLRALLVDEDGNVQGGVLSGLVITAAGSGDLAIDVSAGVAFVNNASGLADATFDSAYRRIQLDAAVLDVALEPADGTHARIDVVSIAWAYGTSKVESRNVRAVAGGSPSAENIATLHGPAPILVVTAGTPSSSPAAPSTPSGHIKLGQVQVAAGATTSAGLTVQTTGRQVLPTVQRPIRLAGGTWVDGNLNAEGQINANGGFTGTSILLGLGVLAGGDGVFGGSLSSASSGTFTGIVSAPNFVGLTSRSDLRGINTPVALGNASAILFAREDEAGTPASDAHVLVVTVNRGSETHRAHLRWEETVDAWQLHRATDLEYQGVVLGGYRNGSTNHNDKQGAVWAQSLALTLVGGAAEETFNGTHNANNLSATGGEAYGVANINGTSGSSAAKALIRLANVTGTGYTITFRTHDGSNFVAGEQVFVSLLIFGRAAG